MIFFIFCTFELHKGYQELAPLRQEGSQVPRVKGHGKGPRDVRHGQKAYIKCHARATQHALQVHGHLALFKQREETRDASAGHREKGQNGYPKGKGGTKKHDARVHCSTTKA